MHQIARLLLVAVLTAFAVSLAFMAAARPAAPSRVAGYGVVIRTLGRWMYWWSAPLVGWLHRRGASADQVTWAGFLLTSGAAVLAGFGGWGLAGLALMAGALCDVVDGELARRGGPERPAGAFLDSALDRLSELVLFGGLATGLGDRSGVAWAFAAAAASTMVSYARARGEGLGVRCPGGGLERPHRVLILMFALLFAPLFPESWAPALAEAACAVVALGAGATAVARMRAIHGQLISAESHAKEAAAQPQTADAEAAPFGATRGAVPPRHWPWRARGLGENRPHRH